jgi:hypothetical protein
MRTEIDLVGEAGDAQAADVVLEQREGNDEGHEAAAVLGDHLAELGALVVVELALEEHRQGRPTSAACAP